MIKNLEKIKRVNNCVNNHNISFCVEIKMLRIIFCVYHGHSCDSLFTKNVKK